MAETAVQKSLQTVRILHIGFLGAAIAYIFMAQAYSPPVRHISPPLVPLAMGIVSLCALGLAMFYRNRMVQPASEQLRNNPEDEVAIGRWRSGVIVSLVFCESVVLLGFLLKLIGNSWNVCGIFYAVGIFFMLVWWPRLELPPS